MVGACGKVHKQELRKFQKKKRYLKYILRLNNDVDYKSNEMEQSSK